MSGDFPIPLVYVVVLNCLVLNVWSYKGLKKSKNNEGRKEPVLYRFWKSLYLKGEICPKRKYASMAICFCNSTFIIRNNNRWSEHIPLIFVKCVPYCPLCLLQAVSGCAGLPDMEGEGWVAANELRGETDWNEAQFIIQDSSWKLQAYYRLWVPKGFIRLIPLVQLLPWWKDTFLRAFTLPSSLNPLLKSQLSFEEHYII